ncbi:MAG: GNAT family N-acetyltransferase [Magnetococcales bacterium]|nr:GNAT family N-acetyltransferase [Magnetococcales bacterium]
MSIRIEPLAPHHRQEYATLLQTDPRSLIFASNGYLDLLAALAPAATCHRWVARDASGTMRGAMNFFILPGKWGGIANALPFFGSPCGLVVPDGSAEIKAALLEHFLAVAQNAGCSACTFITSPLDPDPHSCQALLSPTFEDERIGLITPLPAPSATLEQDLLALCQQKTRNLIRKGMKAGFRLDRSDTRENWRFLQETHLANMAVVNGASRPGSFFTLMEEGALPDLERRLYTACLDETPVAGLLLLYHQQTVEYFVPAIQVEHRASQPLSFLILQAMREAVMAGYRWWNWGGTWLTQKSLYHFKKGFGATDHHYYYYVKIFDPSLLAVDRQELLREYPLFFTYPFNQVLPAPIDQTGLPRISSTLATHISTESSPVLSTSSGDSGGS